MNIRLMKIWLGICLLSVLFFSTSDVEHRIEVSRSSVNIQSLGKEWVVTKHTGIESDFELHFINSKDKSTRICFTPKADVDVTGNTGDRVLLDVNNNPILDNQNKEISLKYESSKCDINGTKYDGYTVDLSTEKMINVRDYLKFGVNSIVLEYQDANIINYQSSWFNINVSLAVNLSGEFDSSINDIWVFTVGDDSKFGANFTSSDLGHLQFKYTVNPNRQIKKGKGFEYYLSKVTDDICGSLPCTNEERHVFNFEDICKPRRNNTRIFGFEYDFDTSILFDPQCSFELSNDTLEVLFYSEYNATLGMYSIDPNIVITDVSTATSVLNNVTCETGFCHLSVNDSQLEVYLPFDVIENKSTNITYDYTGNNHDGVMWRSDSAEGFIGNASRVDFTKNGAWGGVIIPDSAVFSGVPVNDITFSIWIKPDTLTANHGTESIFINKGSQTGGGDPRAEYRFQIRSNGAVEFRGMDYINSVTQINPISTTGIIVAGDWHHIALVWNGSQGVGSNQAEIYLNGVSVALAESTGAALCGDQTTDFELAGREVNTGTNSRMFNGSVDEFMMWNKVLSATEIMDIYLNQSNDRLFSIGSQEFENLNASDDGVEENRLNISINTSNFFDSVINITVGNATAGGYIYSQELEFVNGQVLSVGVSNASNFTLKFIYHPGNSSDNPFISPNLLNDIRIESYLEDEGDIVDPVITNVRNTTTTNVSSDVNWTVDEASNYTILLYNATGRFSENLKFTVYNTTFLSGNVGQNFSALLNFTEYLINLTVCDSSGNCAVNNSENFTTAQTIPSGAADPCSYSGSGDWNVNFSDNCVIDTYTNLNTNLLNLICDEQGSFTVENTIDVNKWQKNGTNQCLVHIPSGGMIRAYLGRTFDMGNQPIPTMPVEPFNSSNATRDPIWLHTFELIGNYSEFANFQGGIGDSDSPQEWYFYANGTQDNTTNSIRTANNFFNLSNNTGLDVFRMIDSRINGSHQIENAPEEWNQSYCNLNITDAIVNFSVRHADVQNGYYSPTYLSVFSELNSYVNTSTDQISCVSYIINETSRRVKLINSSIIITTTFQYESLQGLNDGTSDWDILQELEPSLDAISITTYPTLYYDTPELLPDSFLRELRNFTNKSIFIAETSWPEEINSLSFGSNATQIRYLQKIHRIANDINISLLNWQTLTDFDYAGDFFDSHGLMDDNGVAKPVWDTWTEMSLQPMRDG